MTIYRLHKILGDLMAKGHRRTKVCIHKRTFTHPLEPDGCVILDVRDAIKLYVPQADGDGFTATRADGTEVHRNCIVLVGDNWPSPE